MEHFTCGTHPEYQMTRCFFAVNSQGEKTDFSAAKCIKNMQDW